MKAFIGRSFEGKDDKLAARIQEHIESTGVDCFTAKRSESESIAAQVKRLISSCDIFVGLFTCDEKIHQKKDCWGKKQKRYTTSNWVIQESGYAIGQSKGLIFLVEKGLKKEVYKFPGLQGDLEVIYFEREAVERAFTKLNQMIDGIGKKQMEGVAPQAAEAVRTDDEAAAEEGNKKPGKEIPEEAGSLLAEVTDALYKEKDPQKAQILFESIKDKIPGDKRPVYHAAVLGESFKLGDVEAFGKLLAVVRENPDNPDVNWVLAYRYREMGEYEKAKEQYLTTKNKYDIEQKEQRKEIVDCYSAAARCLASDNRHQSALDILQEALLDDRLGEYKGHILPVMARICKRAKDLERFFVYGEISLDINPSDTELRFDLAYAYADEGNHKLSWVHYKKLTDTVRHPSGQNNLAVEYQTLELPGKSVASYLKANELNSTHSMGNLAIRYLNRGFTEDAKKLIAQAYTLANDEVEISAQVGKAQEMLDNSSKTEEEKERVVLLQGEKERKFRLRYSRAFCSNRIVKDSEIEGAWATPWGDLSLVFPAATGQFEIRGTVQEKKSELGLILPLPGLLTSKPKESKPVRDRSITISGEIHKLSGKYSVQIEDKAAGLLSGSTKVYEAAGYMVISEKCDQIDVMEKTKDDKASFKSWQKRT